MTDGEEWLKGIIGILPDEDEKNGS